MALSGSPAMRCPTLSALLLALAVLSSLPPAGAAVLRARRPKAVRRPPPAGAKEGQEAPEQEPQPELKPLDPSCARFAHDRYVRPTTTLELYAALGDARAGDLIELPAGTSYAPTLVQADGRRINATIVDKAGTPERPIIVCGPRSAVIDGSAFWTVNTDTFGNVHGFQVRRCGYVWLVGFSIVKGGLTGVTVEESHHCIVDSLAVSTVLATAIRVRGGSTYNIVQKNVIKDTGHRYAGIGEGIYVGTTPDKATGQPQDRSNYNKIIGNIVGPTVTAEAIDAKEFTEFGEIRDNYFDMTHLSNLNGADACIDVKGSRWLISGNTCYNTCGAGNCNGFQVSEHWTGWGYSNTFTRNTCSGRQPGFCIYSSVKTWVNGQPRGDQRVLPDNNAGSAAKGLTNVYNAAALAAQAATASGKAVASEVAASAAGWARAVASSDAAQAAAAAVVDARAEAESRFNDYAQ